MSLNWGILATGNIAHKLAEALHAVDGAELVAIGSRSLASAETFANKWNIRNRHGSYEALAHDPDVDIIYIATPHSFHYENMLLCLEAGKHVLCEKPLTLNAYEAQVCIKLARKKNLFLMEAIWMRFMPAILQVKAWLEDGLIGDVRLVEADFCINRPFDPAHRLYNPALGGGALLDLGIYPLALTTCLLGFPESVVGKAEIGRTGTDDLNVLVLTYANGALATLRSCVNLSKPITATIHGTAGTIHIHEMFLRPDSVTVTLNGHAPVTHTIPYAGNGYPHEVVEVQRCIAADLLESPLLTHAESLRMMQLMDGLRADWGVSYPTETTAEQP